MSRNADKRKCSAVCSGGQPCRSWAVIESDPPLCPVHAGLNVGKGAKMGNRNAMTHGLYRAALEPDDVADLELVMSTSLAHELMLARIVLRRMSAYLKNEDLSQTDLLAISPVMSTMMRTVIKLQGNIDDSSEWDEVLDDLGKDWGMDL